MNVHIKAVQGHHSFAQPHKKKFESFINFALNKY